MLTGAERTKLSVPGSLKRSAKRRRGFMVEARLATTDGGTCSAAATGYSSTTILLVVDCSSEICTPAGVWRALVAGVVDAHGHVGAARGQHKRALLSRNSTGSSYVLEGRTFLWQTRGGVFDTKTKETGNAGVLGRMVDSMSKNVSVCWTVHPDNTRSKRKHCTSRMPLVRVMQWTH